MRTLGNKSKLTALGAATLVAFALALVVGTHQAGATGPPSGGGPAGNSNNSLAVGAFTPLDTTTVTHVAFAAQKSPKGTYAGYVVEELASGTISGPVTCLTVNGMNARIKWTVNHADSGTGSTVGDVRQLDVTDMGEPVLGVPPDFYTDQGTCDDSGNSCSSNCCDCGTTTTGQNALLHGNIVVKSS
jgi:hypothetical protein